MPVFSATDAISPAFARAKLILFTPFRAGRSWKLSQTAYLSTMGTLFMPFPLFYLIFLPVARQSSHSWAVPALLGAILFLTALFVVFFYLGSRLQFVLFDIVLYREQFVAPAWRKYSSPAYQWTIFKMIAGTIASVAVAVPIAPFVMRIYTMTRTMQPGQPPSPAFISSLFAGYGVFLLLMLALFLVAHLLADFVVPSLALENLPIRDALRRMALLIRQEPGEFALYTLLKICLTLAGFIGGLVAVEIVFFVVGLILMLLALVVGAILHAVGVPSMVVSVTGIALMVAFYGVFLYGMFFVMGAVVIFLKAYAIYFLAGRYPLLGEQLALSEPPPASFFFPPSAFYPPPPPLPE